MRRTARVVTILLALSLLGAAAAPALDGSGDFIRPREGQELKYRHVRFWWPQLDGLPVLGWTLHVVVDDGAPDPFASPASLVIEAEAAADEPRVVIESGLEWGTAYAWRADARTPFGTVTGDIHRFSTAVVPDAVPEITLLKLEPDLVHPGVTLCSANDRTPGNADEIGVLIGVDAEGELVWFHHRPEFETDPSNVRQYDDGRIALVGPRRRNLPGVTGRASIEETLDGRLVWESPDSEDLIVHHDYGRMPEGSPILLVHEWYRLPEDNFRQRRGDRIVVVDRHTGDETWAWRTIDHYALGDGQAPALIQWTHGNAAHYSEADNSFYFSSRHFSRITRIDFATGEVVWNMGYDQPSGDTDFGHDLFSYQHAPERQPNGNILLFDNGNLRIPPYSRAIEIALDDPDEPTEGTIVWEYVTHDESFLPAFSGAIGDADRLPNGNTLIDAGQLTMLYEVTADGTLAWWLKLGTGFPSNVTYRADRIDALNVDTPGDADGDWDIDLMDVAAAQLAAGREAAGFPGRLSDATRDGAVDAADLARLVYWMTAPVD